MEKFWLKDKLRFYHPKNFLILYVTARYNGNSGTDFGAPMIVPVSDRDSMDLPEFTRLQGIMVACWKSLDQAAQHADGRELRKGPRGGGRDLGKILVHVLEAELAYLAMIGWKVKGKPAAGEGLDAGKIRSDILLATEKAYQGPIEDRDRGAANDGHCAIFSDGKPGTCWTMPGRLRTG